MKKKIITILFCILSYYCFSDGFSKDDILYLNLKNDKIIINCVYYDNSSVLKSFTGVLESDPYSIVVRFENDEIYDIDNKIIVSFKNYDPAFYGFKIKPSYPVPESHSPGLNLFPYFYPIGSVGDSLLIVWDYNKRTFKRMIFSIP
ncbi:hypothetical protein [Spirochaeta cellobiosiphila]|uniref:hypothetical protein n=1 Tax=Spirochaeta cellobiosiphila TaxID=504483 RepID=UPI0012EB5922|nr:hypothetical protein [Spirochaeta cellobiosiphila]